MLHNEYLTHGDKWLIDCMTLLSYKPDQNGICQGLGMVALLAGLSGEIDRFSRRLKLIHDIDPDQFEETIYQAVKLYAETSAEITNDVSEVAKQKFTYENLTDLHPDVQSQIVTWMDNEIALRMAKVDDEDLALLAEVPAFFQSIIIAQQIEEFPHLIDPENKDQFDTILHLITPKKLEKEGGVAILKDCQSSGDYNLNELLGWIEKLDSIVSTLNYPIAFALKSANHTISICFDLQQKIWLFTNAAQLPTLKFKDLNELTAQIANSVSMNENIIFFPTPYVAKKFATDAQEKLHFLGQNSPVTQDSAARVDSEGSCRLLLAAELGELEVVRELLQQGADPNSLELVNFKFPLLMAVQANKLEVARLLLEQKTDPNLCIETDQYTQDKIDRFFTPLQSAVINRNSAMVKLLLEHRADPNLCLNGFSALQWAVKTGVIEVIDILLKEKANINFYSEQVTTPLQIAIEQNNLPVVKLLLEKGADPLMSDNANRYPIQTAAQVGNLDIFKLFLSHDYDFDNMTPPLLLIATINGHLPLVKFLIEECHANPNEPAPDIGTPLTVAINQNDINLAEVLIEHGANINVTDEDNNTLLHQIFLNELNEEIQDTTEVENVDKEFNDEITLKKLTFLLDKGIDPSVCNKQGERPLDLAIKTHNVNVVLKLLEYVHVDEKALQVAWRHDRSILDILQHENQSTNKKRSYTNDSMFKESLTKADSDEEDSQTKKPHNAPGF